MPRGRSQVARSSRGGSQTGVGRHRSHSGSDEAMNKSVLAHIRSDRPSNASLAESLFLAPTLPMGTEDRPSRVEPGSSAGTVRSSISVSKRNHLRRSTSIPRRMSKNGMPTMRPRINRSRERFTKFRLGSIASYRLRSIMLAASTPASESSIENGSRRDR